MRAFWYDDFSWTWGTVASASSSTEGEWGEIADYITGTVLYTQYVPYDTGVVAFVYNLPPDYIGTNITVLRISGDSPTAEQLMGVNTEFEASGIIATPDGNAIAFYTSSMIYWCINGVTGSVATTDDILVDVGTRLSFEAGMWFYDGVKDYEGAVLERWSLSTGDRVGEWSAYKKIYPLVPYGYGGGNGYALGLYWDGGGDLLHLAGSTYTVQSAGILEGAATQAYMLSADSSGTVLVAMDGVGLVKITSQGVVTPYAVPALPNYINTDPAPDISNFRGGGIGVLGDGGLIVMTTEEFGPDAYIYSFDGGATWAWRTFDNFGYPAGNLFLWQGAQAAPLLYFFTDFVGLTERPSTTILHPPVSPLQAG